MSCVVVCCVCVMMMCCRVASCFVCLFCEVAVYFLRLYDMELVLTLRVGARYHLNQSKIFEFKNLTTIYVARRAGFEFGGGANGQRQPCLIKKTWLLKYIGWLLEYLY